MDPNTQFAPPAGNPVRRRKTEQGAMNPIEATVTKLLVATKQLLEGLTLWSTRKMTEDQVSDIFVQLATQFNMATQSFHEVGIDTSELAHIPDDLRNCLETALGEEPSPSSLDQYLPKIKEVIINLLQGLRMKQNLYRDQTDAKAARIQSGVTSGRSKSNGSAFRQPNTNRTLEGEGGDGVGGGASTIRSQSLNAGPPPTVSISSPRDEQGHAEALASLRKSDAITRRASSRRHSQRFSTLLEQNAPPVPRRNPMTDPTMLSTYPGYTSPHPSSPLASPNGSLSYGQFSPLPTFDSYPDSPALSTSSMNKSMDGMPPPPAFPMPAFPNNLTNLPSSDDSPLLGSSSMMNTDVKTSFQQMPSGSTSMMNTDVNNSFQQVPSGSTETLGSLVAPTISSTIDPSSALSLPSSDASGPVDTGLTLFLQVGKSVKKTKFEGELTLSGLRMLFMEKFQYNPGQEDFPTIYVKDPQTNIHYELESLGDVKQNAFLSLNVDDLENIQRKMDQGFAALSKELSEIKKAQEATEAARQKTVNNAPERSATSNPESSPILRSLVQKVLTKTKAATPSTTGQGPIVVADLKPQQDEVRSLRRDLGVVRQMYTELQSETKTMLGSLAGYTSQIRKQALEQPVSARMFIESGKVKLDKKSEDLTNKIEDLQDVVEDMKVNVTQRRGRPSDISMTFVDKQCEEIEKDLAELSDYIQSIRPSWKKTWEVELQTIVKEQMFLKEQEALLEDLKEDRGSLMQTLANLKKLLELQDKNGGVLGGKPREFVFQPANDEGFEGLKTVMEEVKMIEPDSNKRLKAMAQMEKLRHIELSNRIDEFEEELTTFVGASKLRKTGGAQEVERQRQQRDLENLKAMFAKKEQEIPVAGQEDGA
ncbi:Bud site selection protein 6 [Mortierella sp. AD032]|nr:Bud site selection protein 6 [Mortierella sp. AD032]